MANQLPKTASCPICEAIGSEFFRIGEMPIQIGRLCATRDEALDCPRGDIHLAYCNECSMIWNTRFDASSMDDEGAYDNTLFFSSVHRQHAKTTAERLIEKYDLHGKDVVEVGCGEGEFLKLLCELGPNRGVGLDPHSQADHTGDDRVRLVHDTFDERYLGLDADLVCSRYLLEHVPEPVELLRLVHSVCERRGAVAYFEVPNAALIFREGSIWDIICEHYAIFCERSLVRAFQAAGFAVRDVGECNHGLALWIEAHPGKQADDGFQPPDDGGSLAASVSRFADDFNQLTRDWQTRIDGYAEHDRTVVAWGAGAKGISFFNMLKIRDQVHYIVDINPRKNGCFVPCTGQEIVAPAALKTIGPDVVVVMNPVYAAEIREILRAEGLETEIVCV